MIVICLALPATQVEYAEILLCRVEFLREKYIYTPGAPLLSIICWRTVPIAASVASVRKQVRALDQQADSRKGLSARLKGTIHGIHVKWVLSLRAVFKRSCKGWRIWEQIGRKRRYNYRN